MKRPLRSEPTPPPISNDISSVQERFKALLTAQQNRGVPLVQRREDGVYVKRYADGTEIELLYRDRPDNLPYE
jgi:hypothetical protein